MFVRSDFKRGNLSIYVLQTEVNGQFKDMNHHEQGHNLKTSNLALVEQRMFAGYTLRALIGLDRSSFQVREMSS